jgi:mannose-6-phosphate isomerase-like protein (cupin superfamily)
MNPLVDWRDHVGVNPQKFYKTTLWEGEFVTVGLNCLEPGQTQSAHVHLGAEKFYFVLEGRGSFIIEDRELEAEPGILVQVPAGVSHGVQNKGTERLSVLVGIAPGVK